MAGAVSERPPAEVVATQAGRDVGYAAGSSSDGRAATDATERWP